MRLRAANLGIDRGGTRILSGVTFTLNAGEALLVTGENGSGKSSLLRALAGLLPLAEGAVVGFEGETAHDPPFHYLGHRDGLKPHLAAAENLAFAARWFGAAAGSPSPTDALARFGLAQAAETPVGWLSSGQRRRVALARLLVAPRPLWLLDEPTTGLDAPSVAAFEAVAAAHLAGGGLIVAVTHLPLRLPARELRLAAA